MFGEESFTGVQDWGRTPRPVVSESLAWSLVRVGTAAPGCPSGRRPDFSPSMRLPRYKSSRASLTGQPRAAVPT